MPRLTLDAVHAGYDRGDVLHDISLDVADGELLVLLGPSGGGKSTLLRVIAGLEPARSGRVRLGDRDLTDVPAHERGVGLMFQDYALFPHRDVAGNVGFGLRMQGRRRADIDRRVGELLELVGLAGAGGRPVAELSGGEQQRVALARALAPEPRVLLLDEPMGSLDRSLRERLPDELRSIVTDLGLTVLYVTHDQDEALSVADRVALLAEGRLVALDAPERLWTSPPTAWAARFLGARNVAEGHVSGGRVETPWGPLDAPPAAAEGPVWVVIRPSLLEVSPSGSWAGRVVGRRFAGDTVVLTIEPDGGGTMPLAAEVHATAAPHLGEAVRVGLRPGAPHLIARTG